MDFRGRYSLPARPDTVWTALHDPEILAACIPGCEGVTRVSDAEYRAQATMAIGPVKARFSGKVTWTDEAPPDGFTHAGRLAGEGQGGPAGFARGESEVRLAAGPDQESCVLTYEAKAMVGGRLAQIGQRLIDAAAKSIADQFFASFAGLMRTGTTLGPDLTQPVSAVAPAPSVVPVTPPPRFVERRAEPRDSLKSQVWLVGLIAIVIILLALFSVVL
jgi:carbon monoxide dehydrogenase subunit G